MKPITANHKKKRPPITKHNLEKMHDHQLDMIDRFSRVYTLSPAMKTLWEVVFRSGELIAGQIRLLKERTGEAWSRYSYWKLRRKLEREIWRA